MVDRSRESVNVYRRVTEIVWQRLAPTFGLRTINAIARNAIALQAKSYPRLTYLTVGPDGLLWDELNAHLGELDEEQTRAMLDAFLDEFFEAIANLVGRLVVGKVFREAEEEAGKGGGE